MKFKEFLKDLNIKIEVEVTDGHKCWVTFEYKDESTYVASFSQIASDTNEENSECIIPLYPAISVYKIEIEADQKRKIIQTEEDVL